MAVDFFPVATVDLILAAERWNVTRYGAIAAWFMCADPKAKVLVHLLWSGWRLVAGDVVGVNRAYVYFAYTKNSPNEHSRRCLIFLGLICAPLLPPSSFNCRRWVFVPRRFKSQGRIVVVLCFCHSCIKMFHCSYRVRFCGLVMNEVFFFLWIYGEMFALYFRELVWGMRNVLELFQNWKNIRIWIWKFLSIFMDIISKYFCNLYFSFISNNKCYQLCCVTDME